MTQIWAGIDAGKAAHHCVAIDADGRQLLSRRVGNDEAVLTDLVETVTGLASGDEVVWAIDMHDGLAALVLALLINLKQTVTYLPGRAVHHASALYRGDGKTDAKDAAVIADQARMRRDLVPLRPEDDITVELRLLTARRTDLIADRTRAINRLRATLLGYFPALERAFDYKSRRGAVILLTRYNTPAALRRNGVARIEAWLRKQGVVKPAEIAQVAVQAGHAQHTVITGQDVATGLVSRLAKEVITLDTEVATIDEMIEARFLRHRHAQTILSMPGFGPLLGAEFIAATGGDMAAYPTADRLASIAGLAPVPRDSGRVSGNVIRPQRFNRTLLRTCYLAAMVSIRTDPASATYYQRKRAEGKRHTQAVIALARRRNNVLYAMLRDGSLYQPRPADTKIAA